MTSVPFEPTSDPDALLAEARWVHRLARALVRDPELAHDVAQDALVAAMVRTPRREVRDPRGWLQAVTRRLAGRALRQRRERTTHETRAGKPEACDREARNAERLQLHRRLCDAVLALPEPYRTAITMRFLDDLPPRAIGRQLHVDASVVRQRVHRGLALLRERLDAEAGDRQAWLVALAPIGSGPPAGVPFLLLPLFAMKKFAIAAVILLTAAAWWLAVPSSASHGPDGATPPVAGSVAAAAAGSPQLADPAAATATQRTALEWVVRVLDEAGQPLPRALVNCWHRDGPLPQAETGSDGRCTFAATDEDGGVYVRRDGFQPVLQEVPRLRGVTEIVLGVGSKVTGRLLEDGRPPSAGFFLRLSLPSLELPAAVPSSMVDRLRSMPDFVDAVTDPDGCFTFAGLADSWSGRLQMADSHWLLPRAGQVVEGDNCLVLTAPQRDLVLETTRLPMVRGRLLWSDGSGGPSGAYVMATVSLADGTDLPSPLYRTDAEGRFAFSLRPGRPDQHARWLDPSLRPAVLRLTCNAYQKTLRVENGGGPIDLAQEFVLRVDRPPLIWFKAVDADGGPVAGAIVPDWNGGLSQPTGADGIGCCEDRLAPATWYGTVGAPGRQIVRVVKGKTIPATRSDPLVVVLPQCNGLRVRLRAQDGSAAEGCLVTWRGSKPIFDGPMGMPSSLETHFGCSTAEWGVGIAAFRCDARGNVMLHSIAPGIAGALVVQDAIGTELMHQELTTPPLGEVRDVLLEVPAQPVRVHGCVRDATGNPTAQVNVELGSGPSKSMATRSASDGMFVFGPVYTQGTMKLVARRRGLAAAECEFSAADIERGIVLILARGRVTTVAILDDTGAVVGDLRPEVKTATGDRLDLQKTEGGEYECSDLPPGEVTLSCVCGGRRFELRHDTANPRAELRVPRPARATIRKPDGWDPRLQGGKLIASLTPIGEGGNAVRVDLSQANDPPLLFLPGRYRVALELMTWNPKENRSEYAEQGPAAELELRPGEVTNVQLR